MVSARIKRMPHERLRRLVDIAANEFAAVGYEDASLNRIIEECGMSKSSFYYVLASKAELFDFVVRTLIDEVSNDFDVPAPEEFAGRYFWQKLRNFFDTMVVTAQHRSAFQTLGRVFYSQAPPTAASAVSATLAAAHDWVAEVVRVGRRSGAVRTDLPEALQIGLAFRVLQMFDEWTVAHVDELAPEDVHALADAQFAAIRRLLATSPA